MLVGHADYQHGNCRMLGSLNAFSMLRLVSPDASQELRCSVSASSSHHSNLVPTSNTHKNKKEHTHRNRFHPMVAKCRNRNSLGWGTLYLSVACCSRWYARQTRKFVKWWCCTRDLEYSTHIKQKNRHIEQVLSHPCKLPQPKRVRLRHFLFGW